MFLTRRFCPDVSDLTWPNLTWPDLTWPDLTWPDLSWLRSSAYSRSASAGPVAAVLGGLVLLLLLLAAGVIISLRRRLPSRGRLKSADQEPPVITESGRDQPSPDLLPTGQWGNHRRFPKVTRRRLRSLWLFRAILTIRIFNNARNVKNAAFASLWWASKECTCTLPVGPKRHSSECTPHPRTHTYTATVLKLCEIPMLPSMNLLKKKLRTISLNKLIGMELCRLICNWTSLSTHVFII